MTKQQLLDRIKELETWRERVLIKVQDVELSDLSMFKKKLGTKDLTVSLSFIARDDGTFVTTRVLIYENSIEELLKQCKPVSLWKKALRFFNFKTGK